MQPRKSRVRTNTAKRSVTFNLSGPDKAQAQGPTKQTVTFGPAFRPIPAKQHQPTPMDTEAQAPVFKPSTVNVAATASEEAVQQVPPPAQHQLPQHNPVRRKIRLNFNQPMSGPVAQTLRTRALNDALATSLITGTPNHHAPRVPCWTFQSHPEGLKHVKSTRDTRNGKSSWNHKFEGWHVPAQTPDQADIELFFEQILTFVLAASDSTPHKRPI